ncbi:hypothetical protein [Streptosporangium vulgare]|uniref:DRBM domain-containing protein n=1 Tax=Streptosporangium vulgare TaxID=46190 RepID=A0ABV5TUG2_9ACTN
MKAWLEEAGIQISPAVPVAAGSSGSSGLSAGVGAGERHPVGVLNELTRQGRIEAVAWTVESTGPSHAPAFTAAAATRLLATNTLVRGEGSGASKTAALLARLDTR